MKPALPPTVQALVASLFDGRGDTEPALRRAVAERAESASLDVSVAAGALPAELDAYVDKVARHAYRVTDDDVAALRSAGHTEDAIFEITLSAALGAGLVRMERGLTALRGAR
jgi:alkylhydroperoxidase family enzyme